MKVRSLIYDQSYENSSDIASLLVWPPPSPETSLNVSLLTLCCCGELGIGVAAWGFRTLMLRRSG
jgi:hypothetical protein